MTPREDQVIPPDTEPMSSVHPYYAAALDLLTRIQESQGERIARTSEEVHRSLEEGGVLHIFGSGHSAVVAQEVFHRAGGLVPVNPILEPFLTPLTSPRKSGRLERTEGIAAILLDYYDLRPGEVLIVVSSSGINALPVEMAIGGRDRGLTVVAITSVSHSLGVPSRHSSGVRVMDAAHILIDNCVEKGDASIILPGSETKVAPLSSLAGIFIINWLTCEVAMRFTEKGVTPPVYLSANLPGGDEHNRLLEERYQGRIKLL